MEKEYTSRSKIRRLGVLISRRIVSSIKEKVWRRRQQVSKSSRAQTIGTRFFYYK